MKLNNNFLVIRDYVVIALGTLLMSLGIVIFLSPNKIAAGGVSGLAIVIHHIGGLPIGLTMLVFNIPLFLLGVKFLGKRFGIRTLFGMLVYSLATDFFDKVLHLQAITDHPLLASLYGGLIVGVGLGFVFKYQASTGGSDIIAQIFSNKGILTAGATFILIDFFVISLAGFFFKGVEYALWGFIALYVSSKVVDVIISGMGYIKSCFVITDKPEKIKEEIYKRMNRGVTYFKGTGAYEKTAKNIIFTTVTRREVAKLRDIVKEIDPDAFVTIQQVHQVMGKGFKEQQNIV